MERDRNLLFGVLAVQLKKVTPSQLVAAAAVWAADQSRDLGDRLVELGALGETERKFIEDVVDRAVQDHSGDAAATLASFGGEAEIYQTFLGSLLLTDSGGVATVQGRVPFESPVQYLDVGEVPGVQETPGRYSQVSEYGRGGMGRVLLVHDAFLGRDVALKELLPGPGPKDPNSPSTPVRKYMGFLSRFLQEARITGQLEHPSIVPVYELGHRRDGTLYYTMKLVRGRTLRQAIAECKTLRERIELLPHFVNLCQAIAYAHSRGIIHRDLKPDNIMVGEFGETVVLDWGLAKAKDLHDVHASDMAETIRLLNLGDVDSAAKTQYGQVMGTPAYMPPEQAKGQLDSVDERSDVYSLGAVLYELVTSCPPFHGKNPLEIIQKVIRTDPKPISDFSSDVSPELVAICARAMAKQQENRYESAKDLADDVHRYLSGALVRSYRYRLRDYLGFYWRRHKPLVATAAAAFVAVNILGALYVRSLSVSVRTERELRSQAELAQSAAERAQKAAETDRDRYEQEFYLNSIAFANQLVTAGDFKQAIGVLETCPEKYRRWEWEYLASRTKSGGWTDSLSPNRLYRPVFIPTILPSYARTLSFVEAPVPGAPPAFGMSQSQGTVDFMRFGAEFLMGIETHFDSVWGFILDQGPILATADAAGSVVCFELYKHDGEKHNAILLDSSVGAAEAAVLSQDRRILAITHYGGYCSLWDITTQAKIAAIGPLDAKINAIAFAPSGEEFVVACDGGTAHVFSIPEGKRTAELRDEAHTGHLWAAAYSYDGKKLATGGLDSVIHLWDAEKGEKFQELKGHKAGIRRLEFTPDDRCLISTSDDTSVRLWDLKAHPKGQLCYGHDKPVLGLTLASYDDKAYVVSCDSSGRTVLWQYQAQPHQPLMSPQLEYKFEIPSEYIRGSGDVRYPLASETQLEMIIPTISPNGEFLLVSTSNNVATLWRLGQHDLRGRVSARFFNNNVFDRKMSRRASYVNRRPDRSFSSYLQDQVIGTLTVNASESGDTIALFGDIAGGIGAVDISADGSRVAAINKERVLVWSVDEQKQLAEIAGKFAGDEGYPVNYRVDLNSDGSLVGAFEFAGPSVTVWDTATGSVVAKIPTNSPRHEPLVFSPDSTILACSVNTNEKNETVLWDLKDGRFLRRFPGEYTVEYTPDMQRVFLESGARMRVLSLSDFRDILTVPIPSSSYFLSDGSTLASEGDVFGIEIPEDPDETYPRYLGTNYRTSTFLATLSLGDPLVNLAEHFPGTSSPPDTSVARKFEAVANTPPVPVVTAQAETAAPPPSQDPQPPITGQDPAPVTLPDRVVAKRRVELARFLGELSQLSSMTELSESNGTQLEAFESNGSLEFLVNGGFKVAPLPPDKSWADFPFAAFAATICELKVPGKPQASYSRNLYLMGHSGDPEELSKILCAPVIRTFNGRPIASRDDLAKAVKDCLEAMPSTVVLSGTIYDLPFELTVENLLITRRTAQATMNAKQFISDFELYLFDMSQELRFGQVIRSTQHKRLFTGVGFGNGDTIMSVADEPTEQWAYSIVLAKQDPHMLGSHDYIQTVRRLIASSPLKIVGLTGGGEELTVEVKLEGSDFVLPGEAEGRLPREFIVLQDIEDILNPIPFSMRPWDGPRRRTLEWATSANATTPMRRMLAGLIDRGASPPYRRLEPLDSRVHWLPEGGLYVPIAVDPVYLRLLHDGEYPLWKEPIDHIIIERINGTVLKTSDDVETGLVKDDAGPSVIVIEGQFSNSKPFRKTIDVPTDLDRNSALPLPPGARPRGEFVERMTRFLELFYDDRPGSRFDEGENLQIVRTDWRTRPYLEAIAEQFGAESKATQRIEVLSINGTPTSDREKFSESFRNIYREPPKEITVVVNIDGKKHSKTWQAGEPPKQEDPYKKWQELPQQNKEFPASAARPLLQQAANRLRRARPYMSVLGGLLMVDTPEFQFIQAIGIKPGDVIQTFNEVPIVNESDIRLQLELFLASTQNQIRLGVLRDGNPMIVMVTLR